MRLRAVKSVISAAVSIIFYVVILQDHYDFGMRAVKSVISAAVSNIFYVVI